jgi:hypothetical protein
MPFNRKSLDNLKQNRARPPAEDRAESDAQSVVVESVSGTVTQGLAPMSAPEILRNAAPGAAFTLAAAATGGRGVPWHVKVQAAIRVLEGQGHLPKQAEQGQPDDAEGFLERVRQALEIRRRKAEAVDA